MGGGEIRENEWRDHYEGNGCDGSPGEVLQRIVKEQEDRADK